MDMASSQFPPPRRVVALCRTLVEATACKKDAYWLSIYGVREAMGVTFGELNEALAYAIAAGLVRSDEEPPCRLIVTYEGIELARSGR
jgi:hypothetical protein